MGLLTEKLTCKCCGKTFRTQNDEFDGLCNRCGEILMKESFSYLLEKHAKGFISAFKIARGVCNPYYIETAKTLVAYRDHLLQTHKNENFITPEAIIFANQNFYSLTDMQKLDVAKKITSSIAYSVGSNYICGDILYTGGGEYGVAIDLTKVVMIAYNPNFAYRGNNVTCVGIITNDPYMPFYKFTLGNRPRILWGNAAKSSINNLNEIYFLMNCCPNLKYPLTIYNEINTYLSSDNFCHVQQSKYYLDALELDSKYVSPLVLIDESNVYSNNFNMDITNQIKPYGYIPQETVEGILGLHYGYADTPLGQYVVDFNRSI